MNLRYIFYPILILLAIFTGLLYKYESRKIYFIDSISVSITQPDKITIRTHWWKPFADKNNWGPKELIEINSDGKILFEKLYKEDPEKKQFKKSRLPGELWKIEKNKNSDRMERLKKRQKSLISPVRDTFIQFITGGKIIFRRLYRGKKDKKPLFRAELWTSNVYGTIEKKLMDVDFTGWEMSKNKEKLYFTKKGEMGVYIIKTESKRKITDRYDVRYFILSPENKKILFSTKNNDIYLADIDGANIKLLFSNPQEKYHGFDFIDEKKIVFREKKSEMNELIIYDIDNSEQKRIKFPKNSRFDLINYMGTKNKLLLLKEGKTHEYSDSLWTVNINGTGLKQIFPKKILGIF